MDRYYAKFQELASILERHGKKNQELEPTLMELQDQRMGLEKEVTVIKTKIQRQEQEVEKQIQETSVCEAKINKSLEHIRGVDDIVEKEKEAIHDLTLKMKDLFEEITKELQGFMTDYEANYGSNGEIIVAAEDKVREIQSLASSVQEQSTEQTVMREDMTKMTIKEETEDNFFLKTFDYNDF